MMTLILSCTSTNAVQLHLAQVATAVAATAATNFVFAAAFAAAVSKYHSVL